jgi:outer membrane protein assembly factor BamB
VRDGKLVIFHVVPRGEGIECVRADTGESIWKFDYSAITADTLYGDGPRCTPLLTGTRCYTFGQAGTLVCLDLKTGRHIWTRETSRDFNIPASFFGVGCTPILEGDLLIVLVGGLPDSGVVAFRAETGETVWQSVGKDTWDGAETTWTQQPHYRWEGEEALVSYASPIAATIHGKRHVLCLMRHGLVSVDPHHGHVNFIRWFRSRRRDSVTAARPVVIDDKIFLTGSYGLGCTLLQVDPSGLGVKELWRNHSIGAHWSTPIYSDGFLYGFGGRYEQDGLLHCLNLKTGGAAWQTPGYDVKSERPLSDSRARAAGNPVTKPPAPFPFFGRGSLTLVGKKFLVLGERGTLALAEMSPKGYHELSRTAFKSLRYPVWPSPVVAAKRLYLRDQHTLLCVDLAAKP